MSLAPGEELIFERVIAWVYMHDTVSDEVTVRPVMWRFDTDPATPVGTLGANRVILGIIQAVDRTFKVIAKFADDSTLFLGWAISGGSQPNWEGELIANRPPPP